MHYGPFSWNAGLIKFEEMIKANVKKDVENCRIVILTSEELLHDFPSDFNENSTFVVGIKKITAAVTKNTEVKLVEYPHNDDEGMSVWADPKDGAWGTSQHKTEKF